MPSIINTVEELTLGSESHSILEKSWLKMPSNGAVVLFIHKKGVHQQELRSLCSSLLSHSMTLYNAVCFYQYV